MDKLFFLIMATAAGLTTYHFVLTNEPMYAGFAVFNSLLAIADAVKVWSK